MKDVKNLRDLEELLSESKHSSDAIRAIFKWYNFSEEKDETN